MSTLQDILNLENYINGAFYNEGNGKNLAVYDKYENTLIGEVPFVSEAQMEEAIASSVDGFNIIRKWSAGKRSEYLMKLKEAFESKKEAFAELIAREAGKPLSYAKGEVDRCIVTLETAVREAIRFSGEMVPLDYNNGEGKTAFTKRFPIGPIAAISPFNFPLNLALHKIAPALAAGCSITLKPAPQSPLTALAFAKLVDEVGYPAGVVNVLVADIPEAEKMVRDDRFKFFSFTGSPQVGWYLKTICGKKKVALELGGNAAVIVDDSANLKEAAKLTAIGAFLYAGQICISTQRILVVDSVFDEFKSLLTSEINAVAAGNPMELKNSVGPIIDKTHLKRIDDWVKEAVEKGAEVLAGGKILDEEHNIYAPTLLTNTGKGMKVCDMEVFGPVATIEKAKSFEDAIAQTNDSVFGLQAGVFTNRVDHMKYAHEELEVGGVMINNIPGFRIDSMPYGGVKDSGLGREGIKYTMEEITEPRLIVY